MPCHETVYLVDKVLDPFGPRGTQHTSKPGTKAWIFEGRENRESKLLDMVTVARMVRVPCISAFYLTGI